MTTTLRPLSWTVKLLLQSFNEVIKMTHVAPFAPNDDRSPAAFPDVLCFEKANTPVSTATPPVPVDSGQTSTMNLNGIEFQFVLDSEADTIVVNRQVYQPKLTNHRLFGCKLLPANGLKWTQVAVYEGMVLEDAVKQFIIEGIQENAAPMPQKPKAVEKTVPMKEPVAIEPVTVQKQIVAPVITPPSSQSKAVSGKLLAMGDREFPDQKKPGKTYNNYAIVLSTRYGEKSLQGEGLADALAEAGAVVGDNVSVLRLGQIDVQLVEKGTGRALLDAQGEPRMGKKWLWKITAA